jgi:hypothetical protein
MKEQKQAKPGDEQKPLGQGQGQPEETAVGSAEAPGSTSAPEGGITAPGGGRVLGEGQPVRSLPVQKPPRPESNMHVDHPVRKPRGRLTRDAMKIIGKTLEGYYESVRQEGTPDRFKQLLQQYDDLQERKKESS